MFLRGRASQSPYLVLSPEKSRAAGPWLRALPAAWDSTPGGAGSVSGTGTFRREAAPALSLDSFSHLRPRVYRITSAPAPSPRLKNKNKDNSNPNLTGLGLQQPGAPRGGRRLVRGRRRVFRSHFSSRSEASLSDQGP